MDEQGCPKCKTTKYRNPSLKLLVNACGHSLCESCVETLFIKGSGACPECGVALRRNNYRLQVFEDAGVEKEVDIRRKVLKDFNKKEEDFSSLRDYNDYLEMIETIIFNLVSGVDLESTKKMIEQYKKENRELIKKNQSKLSRDDEYLEQLIDQQRMEAFSRRQKNTEEEQREKAQKRKSKNALIDDLMFSDKAAQDIVATHKQSTKASKVEEAQPTPSSSTLFSTGIRIGQQSVFNSGMQLEENKAYHYVPMDMDNCGPSYPDMDTIMNGGYLNNVRAAVESEVAGGFQTQVACQRAIQDSMCGLFHFSTSPVPFSHPFTHVIAPSPSYSSGQGGEHSPMWVS